MSNIAEEDPEAASLLEARQQELERPEDAEWPTWSGSLRVAWAALQYDRFYGSMGGVGSIYYSSASRYAGDHGMTIGEFDKFMVFLMAMDAEYVEWAAEKAKAEAEKTKHTESNYGGHRSI
ncbi:MAG: hypothetical protein Q7N50_10870 [Armatimonadota bacterium]|nr:hypothetical protein [Armatimonadota bacterium]